MLPEGAGNCLSEGDLVGRSKRPELADDKGLFERGEHWFYNGWFERARGLPRVHQDLIQSDNGS